MIDSERIEAILFDVDGTLRDSDDEAVERLARLVGHRRARRLVMQLETPGQMFFAIADRLHVDPYVHRLMMRLPKASHHRVIPGVAAMVEALASRYPLAVVSAGEERMTRAFLEGSGLERHFQAVATGLTCRYTKPHADPLHWAAAKLGVPVDRCLMVGDTTVDIRAGRRAGTQTVGVLCGFGEREELHREGAQTLLDSTADLADLLSRSR